MVFACACFNELLNIFSKLELLYMSLYVRCESLEREYFLTIKLMCLIQYYVREKSNEGGPE